MALKAGYKGIKNSLLSLIKFITSIGDGLVFDAGELSANLGEGLEFDSDGKIKVSDPGSSVTKDNIFTGDFNVFTATNYTEITFTEDITDYDYLIFRGYGLTNTGDKELFNAVIAEADAVSGDEIVIFSFYMYNNAGVFVKGKYESGAFKIIKGVANWFSGFHITAVDAVKF